MIIKAGDEQIEAKQITKNEDSLSIVLEGGVTDEQLAALQSGTLDIDDGYTVYSGYTELSEHTLILRKPSVDEIADMKAALKRLGVVKGETWVQAAEKLSPARKQ